MKPVLTSFFLAATLICAGCGGVASKVTTNPPPPSATADHVFLVVLENHSFGQVIGNPAMPYLNGLATAHSLAADYFANAHPSIPNYFMLTTGNLETFDDNFPGTISDDNIVRALTGAGKTWKAYIESIPSVGYTGPSAGTYLKRHNPFAYLTDVAGSPAQAAHMVPFPQLSADLNAGSLPNFVYILPNSQDDAHDCPGGGSSCTDDQQLAAADAWLKANIDPVINNPKFGNSVLIITFDESVATDFTNGGGQVATVLVGPHVKTGFRSSTTYQHQSLLRTVLQLLSVGDMPGASAIAPSMGEFFQ
ncbi:MAG TPA: alkaline phosphatase family protein [Candidatus Angelobacter sp.]|nr:alkaline phosphatase family protein [Candidatus Angelobacter sp.]